MDIIEKIEIPSFERKNANFRRNFAIAAGCVGLFYALEQYNGSVSRTWKSVCRGVTAAIAAWLEDHGGFPIFSPEGDETAHIFQSGLDINGLCGPRFTHDDGATTANAAAYLTQSQIQNQNQQPYLRDAEAGAAISALGGVDPNEEIALGAAAAHLFASADTPSFFQSTKFFACLDVEEARELFRATKRVSLSPHEVLFRSGDPSDSGIYIVLHGTLGVFLEDPTHNTPPIHANTLRSGESVGDLDVVDGAVRTVSCMALESGCLLVNVPRDLFMEFVHSHPRALMLYLQQGLARLWRVAHFVMADFLQLQLYRPKLPGSALQAETAAAATVAASAAGHPPMRTSSNLFGHERGTQTDSFPPSPLSSPPSLASPPTSPAAVIARRVQEAAPLVDVVLGSPSDAASLAAAAAGLDKGESLAAVVVTGADAVKYVDEGVDVRAGATAVGGDGSGGAAHEGKKVTMTAAVAAKAAAYEAADAAGCGGDDAAANTAATLPPPPSPPPTAAPTEAAASRRMLGREETEEQQRHQDLAMEPLLPSREVDDTKPAPPMGMLAIREERVVPVRQDTAELAVALPPAQPRPYSSYASPRGTGTGIVTASTVSSAVSPSPSAPTFNELLASAAASARTRGAGGPTHGPLHLEDPPAPSTMAAAAAAAALLANVPPLPPRTPPSAAAAAAASGTADDAGAPPVAITTSLNLSPVAPSCDGKSDDCTAAGSTAGTPEVPAAVCAPSQPTRVDVNASTSSCDAAAASGSGITDCSTGNVSGSGSTSTISGSTPTSGGVLPAPTAPSAALPPKPPAASASASTSTAAARGAARSQQSQRYGNGGLFGVAPKSAEEGPRPQGPVCRWDRGRSAALRRSFVLGERACLAAGWDVIDVEELAFDGDMWATFSDPRYGVGTQLPLAGGGLLQDVDWASGCFYLLLDGHLLAERPAGPPGGPEDAYPGAAAGPGLSIPGGLRAGSAAVLESALIAPGSLISCAAFLSSTASRCKVVALEPARLVAFSWQTLEALVVESPDVLIRLLVAASAALGPVVRRFISLGLNRVWLESGDVAYRQGDFAECLYVVISGRLRLLHETMHPVTHARQLHLEEEVGRGEAVGAVWAITGGYHDTTALCVRDSELVRMSRSAFRVISADSPLALSKLFSNIARRLVAAWDSRVRSDRGASSSN
ncbi:hypothetical protein Vretifemale_7327, partial [Volvox reticuliferus]